MVREEIYESYAPMVQQVASQYANRYRMVDKMDIQQQLWLWFVEHPRKVQEWANLDQREADKLFARSLRNAAYDFCVKEKARTTGYECEDTFWYSKDFVKTILPSALSEDWKKVEKLSSEIKVTKSPAESGDWMAFAADVRKAYDMLSEKEKALVLLFYAKDVDGETLHKHLGDERPSARATQMAANRAINKMVKTLGGFPPRRERDDDDSTTDRTVEGGPTESESR
jgi:DNA-directed RNA polymerase specialized sigma24 family protein